MKLAVGIIILIITTIFGILLLAENCGACDNATISLHKNMMIGNFGGWILGVVLTIHGYQERRKTKNIEQQKKHDELQDLKDRINELENDKSESQSDSDEIKKLEKKIREIHNEKTDNFNPSAKLIDDKEKKE